MKNSVIVFGVLACVVATLGDGVVTCYWGAWANTRPGIGRFGVSDLPLDLCTHIIYSFIGLTPTGNITLLQDQATVEGKSNTIADFIALKENNTDVKFIAAIGGWNEGTANFSTVSNDDDLRATFVSNIVTFLVDEGFDGLDVDWEYPAQRGGNETDKEAFIWLLQDLKAAFEPKNLQLSLAVAATQANIDISYYVSNISDTVDYIHVMTYDFHGSWDNVTGVNAPLYQQLTDADTDVLNVNASIHAWLDSGADASKLVVGLGAYGHTFTLTSLDDVGTGASVTGTGAAGNYTQEAGTLAYYEICLDQLENEWNITEVSGNYVYGNSGYFWAGYDNESTMYAKGQYAREKGLAGIMFWAVDLDDFSGLCGSSYPLITQGVAGFKGT